MTWGTVEMKKDRPFGPVLLALWSLGDSNS